MKDIQILNIPNIDPVPAYVTRIGITQVAPSGLNKCDFSTFSVQDIRTFHIFFQRAYVLNRNSCNSFRHWTTAQVRQPEDLGWEGGGRGSGRGRRRGKKLEEVWVSPRTPSGISVLKQALLLVHWMSWAPLTFLRFCFFPSVFFPGSWKQNINGCHRF